jgi:hypothetical protein
MPISWPIRATLCQVMSGVDAIWYLVTCPTTTGILVSVGYPLQGVNTAGRWYADNACWWSSTPLLCCYDSRFAGARRAERDRDALEALSRSPLRERMWMIEKSMNGCVSTARASMWGYEERCVSCSLHNSLISVQKARKQRKRKDRLRKEENDAARWYV